MNRQTIFTAIGFTIISLTTQAQQEIATTQFWSTMARSNPAISGIHYRHEANALYRNQWDGVNGAPNSLFVNYSAAVKKIHGGAGISYTADWIGDQREHTAVANYAFHLPLKKYILSLGVAGGLMNLRFKNNWVPPTSNPDPTLPNSASMTRFTSNAGLIFHAPSWNVGASVTMMNSPRFEYTKFVTHYWFFADYTYEINEKVSISPRLQYVTDCVKLLQQYAVRAQFNHFWTGVNFSPDIYLGLMAGYDFLGKYRIGYSYDYTINKLSNVSKGTHEIVIGYLLK